MVLEKVKELIEQQLPVETAKITMERACFIAFFIARALELPCAFMSAPSVPSSGAPPYSS